jgi:hypothetical protein
MLKLVIFVCGLIAVGEATSSRPIHPFGIVEGIVDCGSPGKLGDVEVQGCDAVPCFFEPNSVYDISVKFSASRTSDKLALYVTDDNNNSLLQVPIEGNIEAGIEYQLKFQLAVTDTYSGLTFNIRFQILDISSVFIEVCAQARVTIG